MIIIIDTWSGFCKEVDIIMIIIIGIDVFYAHYYDQFLMGFVFN